MRPVMAGLASADMRLAAVPAGSMLMRGWAKVLQAPVKDPTPEDKESREDLRSLRCVQLHVAALQPENEDEMVGSEPKDRAQMDTMQDPQNQRLLTEY
jgi:hypothetical protein